MIKPHLKRNCGICSSDKTKLIFHQKFILPSKNYFHSGYDVVVCKKCGFAYADNIPDQSILDHYYRDMDKKTYLLKRNLSKETKGQQIEESYLSKQYSHSLKNIIKFSDKKARILDIGCYTGGLLSMLKTNDFRNIMGLDPSPFAVKMAAKKNKVKVVLGSIFDNLNIGKFDLIILTHVLEHISDLKLFIFKVSGLLNENGQIYIEVPDANKFFLAKDSDTRFINDQKEPFLQFSIEHINYFTTKSLLNLMTSNGFQKAYLKPQLSIVSIIASFWKRREIIFNQTVERSLRKYVKDSFYKLKPVFSVIDTLVASRQKIIVWGTGLHTQKLLAISNLSKANIIAFVDSNPSYHGSRLIGKPVYSPIHIQKSKDASILISSKYFQGEIIEQIKRSGYNNKIITLYG